VIDIGLPILPSLGSAMLTQGRDEAVGVEHKRSFHVCLTMIARFAEYQVSSRSLLTVLEVGYAGRMLRMDGTAF
jgi:hypothetical protein